MHVWQRSSAFLILVTFVCALATIVPLRPAGAGKTILFVDAGAPGANDGSSWENAYRSLTAALTDATSGDEIWVAAGVYTPGSAPEHRYELKSGVALYGGFAGGETTLAQRDPSVNRTVLNGQGISNHVVWAHDLSADTLLDGVVITGGHADGPNEHSSGAGIHSDADSATFRDVTIEGNHAANLGGGMLHAAGDLKLENVVVRDNSARTGGGILAIARIAAKDLVVEGNVATQEGGGLSGDFTIAGGRIVGNRAASFGGGWRASGDLRVDRVLFARNHAGRGGAIWLLDGDPLFTNLTFSRNTALQSGGALSASGGMMVFENITSTGNRAGVDGAGFSLEGISTVRRSILRDGPGGFHLVAGGTATMSDALVEGGCPSAVTCTSVSTADPKLGPLADNGGPTRTHALLPGSPAIDAASSCGTVTTDQRGVTRPVDGDGVGGAKCDYGAFEKTPALPLPKCRGRLATITGSPGDDTLTGTAGPDVIVAFEGADEIDGAGGDDIVCAGPGNDRVSGGNGNDVLRGEAGNDRISGDRGADLVFGAAGKDRLSGGPGAGDACIGGPGVDSLLPSHGCESQSGVP